MGEEYPFIVKKSPSIGFLLYFYLVFYLSFNLLAMAIIHNILSPPLYEFELGFHSVLLILITAHYIVNLRRAPPRYEFTEDGVKRTIQVLPGIYLLSRFYRYDELESVALASRGMRFWWSKSPVTFDLGDKDDPNRKRAIRILRKNGVKIEDMEDIFDLIDERKRRETPVKKRDFGSGGWTRNLADPLSSLVLYGPALIIPFCLIFVIIYFMVEKNMNWILAIYWSFIINLVVFGGGFLFNLIVNAVLITVLYGSTTTPSYYRLKEDRLETMYKDGTHQEYYFLDELKVLHRWDNIRTIILKDISSDDGREGLTKNLMKNNQVYILRFEDYHRFFELKEQQEENRTYRMLREKMEIDRSSQIQSGRL